MTGSYLDCTYCFHPRWPRPTSVCVLSLLLVFSAFNANATLSYVKTIDIGPGPHLSQPQRIGLNDSTNTMYVMNTGNNTISVLNTQTRASITTLLRGRAESSAFEDL